MLLGVFRMMRMMRVVRDYLMVTAVIFLLITKITQGFSYWWVAIIVSTALMLPEFIDLRRSGGETRRGDGLDSEARTD